MSAITRFLDRFSGRPADPRTTDPAPITAADPRDTAAKYRIRTIIPAGALITGDVALHESCIVGGIIEGRLLVVGERMAAFVRQGAVIRGGVKADIVMVFGEVCGPIEAEYVHIHPGAIVRGTITAQSLRIERGGTCLGAESRIAPPEAAPAPPPAPPPPAEPPKASSEVVPIRRPTTPEEFRAALERLRQSRISA